MKHRYGYLGVALVLAFALFAQGLSGASARSTQATKLKGTVHIALITSLSGAFSVYGNMEWQGFDIGLKYATNGKMKVDNAKIVVKKYDDASGAGNNPDPTLATQLATNAITNDHADILQCCASSGSAAAVAAVAAKYKKILMVAPAAADTLAGINRYTFRTSRESMQDAITGSKYAVQKFGKTYMTIAQNYSFGTDGIKAWSGVLNKLGATDEGDVLFPLTATDFTPYIQQIIAKHPKFVIPICAGTQCVTLFKQMNDSGLLDQVKVMTGLGNITSWPSFGDSATKIGFIAIYYYKFPKTKANTYLVKQMQKTYHRVPDIFDQDSFAAAQQIVAALKKTHSLSSSKLIKALEGQTVQGPKGPYTIRKSDHVALQPMYIAALTGSGTNLKAKLIATRSAKQTTPPVQTVNW